MTQPTIIHPPIHGTDWAPTGWGPPTPPPAPPAKRKTGRYIIAGLGLFIFGAALVDSGNDTDATAVSATTPTTTRTGSASPVSETVGSSSLVSWVTRYGSDDAATLGADMSALSADAEAMDISGMSTTCRTFQRHLTAAESHLPTPDAQLTSALSDAYGYFGQAATACIQGIASTDPEVLGEMATYLPLGTASLKRATARITALS